MAFPRSYRSLCPAVPLCARARWRAVSQRCVTTQGSVAGPFRSRYKICIATLAPTARALRVVARVAAPSVVSWRIVALYRNPDALYHDPKSPPSTTIQFFFLSRPKGCLAHDTNFVSQHPHLARLRACCARAARRVAGLLGRVACTAGRIAPSSWCTQTCVPTQPAVCLLSLLCAIIQPAVL